MDSNSNVMLISCIEADSRNCTVVVRVVRKWKAIDRTNKPRGIELILLGEEGAKIQASIKQQLMSKFNSLLNEGDLVSISNFKVVENYGLAKYARICHPHKIEFGFNTKVVEYTGDTHIARHGFQFIGLGELSTLDVQYTIDVIGTYLGHSEIERIAAANARKMDVMLTGF